MSIISKQDCYKLLVELNKHNGISIEKEMRELMVSNKVPESILHFINRNRSLEVTNFYNKLRKENNKGKNKLYINIMKDLEDINEILITLSSLVTQIFIYGKNLEGSQRNLFFSSVKLLQLEYAIKEYLINSNSEICIQLLRQIKTDIKVLEQDK